MSAILYRAMLSKVKALLKIEVAHSKDDRQCQQWQLLFTIDEVQFIVGKGGVNTMFYQIGNGERKLCYPDDLIELLESFIKSKTTYAICNERGKVKTSGILTEADALRKKAPKGYYIVGLVDGKKKRLYVRTTGLFKDEWKPFK